MLVIRQNNNTIEEKQKPPPINTTSKYEETPKKNNNTNTNSVENLPAMSQQTSNKPQYYIVLPEKHFIQQAYREDTAKIDCMHFDQDERLMSNEPKSDHWADFSKNFVLQMPNKSIKTFVKSVKEAKIETERKMRLEFDAKLLYQHHNAAETRLNHTFGKDFMIRLKFYIKKYYESL